MPAAEHEAQIPAIEPSIDRAVAMLRQALSIIDSFPGCPDIGARLYEVIETLEQRGPADCS